jgi:uncharacterized protein
MSTNYSESAERFVKEHLAGYDSGHDWWHIVRVRDMAVHIHEAERKGNRTIIELGSLMHDLGDSKFKKQDDPDPGTVISGFLKSLNINSEQINEVVRINRYISFSSRDKYNEKSDELMIVQDADRLDAIGAIGIARAFSYGGFRNNALYQPDVNRKLQEGPGCGNSTIAHFYEKLLVLKDIMNTETGRVIAEERHTYIVDFLRRFFEEWNVEK